MYLVLRPLSLNTCCVLFLNALLKCIILKIEVIKFPFTNPMKIIILPQSSPRWSPNELFCRLLKSMFSKDEKMIIENEIQTCTPADN